MNNNKLFISLYNKLDNLTRIKYKVSKRSYSTIMTYITDLKRSGFYKDRERGDVLDQIRILRNTLVHDETIKGNAMFQISQIVIETLEKEIDILEDPKLSYHVMLKFENIYKAKLSTKLREVLSTMKNKGYSNIPVLSINNDFLGVFSDNVLATYLLEKNNINSSNLTMQDFINYIPIDSHNSERYAFVSRKTESDELVKMFETSKRDYGKRLVCIFVTENGKKQESILGFILPSMLF